MAAVENRRKSQVNQQGRGKKKGNLLGAVNQPLPQLPLPFHLEPGRATKGTGDFKGPGPRDREPQQRNTKDPPPSPQQTRNLISLPLSVKIQSNSSWSK